MKSSSAFSSIRRFLSVSKNDMILNRGHSIDVLNTYFPYLLHTPIPSHIFSPSLVVRDNRGHVFLKGKRAFVATSFAFRHLIQIGYDPVHIGVLSVTSETQKEDDLVLSIRWTFEGTPRYTYFTRPRQSIYEGVCNFTFDDHGWVKEWILVSIYPNPFWYRPPAKICMN